MILSGQGQISRMSLPETWIALESTSPVYNGGQGIKEYCPPDCKDARLSFFYRGAPIAPDSADTFAAILSKPPHALSQEEYLSLWEVLGPVADADIFKASRMETVDLNGRRILLIEGEFFLHRQWTSAIYIDADGSGSFVQQVYFGAPEGYFAKYSTDAERAIASIEWVGLSIADLLDQDGE